MVADSPPPGTELIERLLTLVRRRYPGWEGFDHPRFRKDEIDYKRRAADMAADLLAEEELRRFLDDGRFDEVLERVKKLGRVTNLLYMGTPSTGDLAVLHAEDLEKQAFCRQVYELLYGRGDSAERLDRFAEFLDQRDLPNKWTLPTYLLFLRFPESDYFVKPSVTRWFLKEAGATDVYTSRPNGASYTRILEQVRQVERDLERYEASDLIDVQSVIYVAHTNAQEEREVHPGDAKLQEMESLFAEYVSDYLTTPVGREHQARYEEVRRVGRRSFREIVSAREAGEDVTDRVLLELLPHTDSAAHRESGAWIHVAPAIMGDVRTFFEAAGWREPGDWEDVARAVLDFVQRCDQEPAELERACVEISKSRWSTGLQTGMLTPILNALRPNDFLLVNNKSRRLINYLSGKSLSQKLVDYPDLNRIGHILVEVLADLLDAAPGEGRAHDLFDAFSHWLVSIRRFPFGKPQYWKVAPGESAKFWDPCVEGSFISMGWNDLGDLSNVSRQEFEERRDRLVDEQSETQQGLEQVWKFAKEIREGDRIVANQGTSRVLGFGTVTGPYQYVPEAPQAHHLPVDWDDTRPRRVQQGGWRRTLVSLDRDLYDDLLAAPTANGGSDRLQGRAFELLTALNEEPTKEIYDAHKSDFKACVEAPFRQLMEHAVSLLPEEITERMETERDLYGRILRNDFGRGGAWPFYWGALYPLGSRRIEDAQLALAILQDRVEAGFLMGTYGSDSSKRFLKNVSRLQELLPQILRGPLSQGDLVFGARELREDENGKLVEGGGPGWREWLQDPVESGIGVVRIFPAEDVLNSPLEELAGEIARTFSELFPLVLLSSEEDPLPAIRSYLTKGLDPEPGAINQPYKLDTCASELHLPLSQLQRWVRAIHRKGQAIFYGPPGTGKTYVAEHLARHLIGGGDGFVELVQFHPSYSYEDFIQGLRPEALPDGGLDYPLKAGRFLDFCAQARKRDGICVLIIDEINRADLSRVFGELMYLLEYRDESVPLAAGGRQFSIPPNVRILGTMNTADRSIALVDHALRRRFAFLALRPGYDTLRRHHEGKGEEVEALVEPLIELLREVNGAIDDPHYELGITYFLVDDLVGLLPDVWRMEVVPYLEEYFFDQPEKAEQFQWRAVEERLSR